MVTTRYQSEIKRLEDTYLGLIAKLELGSFLISKTALVAKLQLKKSRMETNINKYLKDKRFNLISVKAQNYTQGYIEYDEKVAQDYIKFLKKNIKLIKLKLVLDKQYSKNYHNLLQEFIHGNSVSIHKFVRDNELKLKNEALFLALLANPSFIASSFSSYDGLWKKMGELAKQYEEMLAISISKKEYFTEKKSKTIKKVAKISDKFSNEVSQLETALSNLKKELFANEHWVGASDVKSGLGWLSLVLAIFLIPVNSYRIMHAALVNKLSIPMRIFNAAMGLLGIGFSVISLCMLAAAFTIAAPILVMAGAVKSCFEASWNLAEAIRLRFFGDGKKIVEKITEWQAYLKTNEDPELLERVKELQLLKQKMHANIFNRVHTLMLTFVIITAAALLFTPAAPIGIFMLFSVATYTIANLISEVVRKKLIIPNPFLPPVETVENTKSAELSLTARIYKKLGFAQTNAPSIPTDNAMNVAKTKSATAPSNDKVFTAQVTKSETPRP